ncbi:preprotein translocase subunit YajC [Phaeocystidibacter luteus]|uniref:Sec translocon accessory complex subunit YajC n=1 Tax=Phaeocystidibacter luteus TaxID=911197 RepID=A0A6N6RM03_9FLAO|nr:preprotein translocase subunit YajC [Phaeocystidibacter luteus]KAB2814600.1 preprotein translocase subunit YajC [Phaeocystidibacter luteus]
MNLSAMFLQAQGGGGMQTILMMVLMIGIIWLFFLRPQARKQKEETKFRDQINKGMKVVTTSGIHGKIQEVGDTYIILEVDGGRMKLEKSAISKELSAQYLPKEDKKSDKKK